MQKLKMFLIYSYNYVIIKLSVVIRYVHFEKLAVMLYNKTNGLSNQ